jgi:hypothetical protein
LNLQKNSAVSTGKPALVGREILERRCPVKLLVAMPTLKEPELKKN